MLLVRMVLLSVIFTILTLPIPCIADEAQTKEPFTFNVEKIPFGKSIEEVLQMVSGAKVKEAEDLSFQTASNFYGLEDKYFKNGVYYHKFIPGRSYLDSDVTKKYTVEYDTSSNISSVSLYFTGTPENGYFLFLVDKEMKNINGNFPTDVSSLVNSISKKVGKKHTTEKSKFRNVYIDGSASDVYPALINVWNTNNYKTILLSNPGLFFGIDTSILSVSNQWWKKYLDLSGKVSAQKRKEQLKQIQKKVDDI